MEELQNTKKKRNILETARKCRRQLLSMLLSNWSLKILSLALAFVLWLLVVNLGNPVTKWEFRNIQVELKNTEMLTDQEKVYEILDSTDVLNKVVVQANRDVLSHIGASDITAVADFSHLTDVHTVPIQLSVPGFQVVDVRVGSDTSENLLLAVEDKKSKNIPVQVQTEGEVALGYVLSSIKADQNRMSISGAASKVEQVAYAQVTVDISGIKQDLSTNESIQLYDQEGNALDSEGINKSASTVRVNTAVLATKEVALQAEVQGEPAAGYAWTGEAAISPEKVRIAGSSSILSAIDHISISGEALDISGRNMDLTVSLPVDSYLPSGTQLVYPDSQGQMSVKIVIERKETREYKIPKEEIQLVGVPENRIEELSDEEEAYTVELTGLPRDLDRLDQTSLAASVDVAAWMEKEGISTLMPTVYHMPLEVSWPAELQLSMEKSVLVRLTFTRKEP